MPGTDFIGTALLAEVEGNYTRRLAELRAELEAMDTADPAERHKAWRAAAEEKVRKLYRGTLDGTTSDSDLTRFSISSPPYRGDDDWSRRDLTRKITETEHARDKAMAYVRALAADEAGIVTVYAADLKRIGYGL